MTTTADLVDQVVDTGRYPLTDPGGPGWSAVVAQARQELRTNGCCVLRDVVRPEAVGRLREESAAVAGLAHFDVETVNVYNTAPDPTLAPDHPARTTMERGNAFVARDQLPPASVVQQLYADPRLQRLVAECFELPAVHELADPLAGLCLNVLTRGREHPWHFDTNECAVSLLTQAPEGGGTFEYCPDIRSAEAEHLEDVAAVLAGRGEHLVRRITVRAGDLQLFRGRYSLHRVTAVEGDTPRFSAIFAYSRQPGVVGSVARTQQLFGRVLPEHLAAAGAARVDRLLT